ncbi:MAG: hypothetical protein GX540_01270 [Clostridiales bacterium]|nr:hypothetical protein [Clostridiales bacterium]
MIALISLSPSVFADSYSLYEYYDTYYDGMPFRAWPVEVQHAFSKELPALIEKYEADVSFSPSLEEVLAHQYGLPGEADLTQEQATAAVIEYLSQDGQENAETLKEYTWTYSFYVDIPDQPEWMITIYDGIYIAQNRLYRLLVPARGGDITLLYDHNTAIPSPEEILEQFSYTLPQDREEWTYLDKARYGDKIIELMALYPEFNADQTYMIYSLPTEEEVSYEDALAFAKDILQKEYGGEGGWNEEDYPLSSAEFVRVSHGKDDIPTPYWGFVMGREDFYQIYVSAIPEGPSLLVVYTSFDANG